MDKLKKVQLHLAKVPAYTNTDLFYPADRIKLQYVKNTISKILSLGEIKSAYDFGCGTGVYVQELINQGINTTGFEINVGARKELKTAEKNIVWADLEYPLPGTFESRDLIFSIEFLEHISEVSGKLCCEEFCGLSLHWIVMTASPLIGEFHLNAQPREYWIDKIENLGTHIYKDELTTEFIEYFKKLIPGKSSRLVWFKRDLMIFEKK